MNALKVGVCGSSAYTVTCAQALQKDARFAISWVVTPPPKPIGRKKIITPTPLDKWATDLDLPVFTVEKSLKPLQSTLLSAEKIDFLLVVDFGYLVPSWLLDLPNIAPINVHPSELPKYRGSSPAQYALLFGEQKSAVTIMRMSEGLDEGPIIRSLPFTVEANETTPTYYEKAFSLTASVLAETLIEYANNRQEIVQPDESPTLIAKRFSKEDGYIPYSLIQDAQMGAEINKTTLTELSPLLKEVWEAQPNATIATLLERSIRALYPWPGIWTIVPHYKGKTNVRMKVLSAQLSDSKKIIIKKVQFEGESSRDYSA